VIRDYSQTGFPREDSSERLPEQAQERKILFCRRWQKSSLSSFTCVRNAQTNSVATNKKAIYQKENHLRIRILQSPAFDRSLYFSDWPVFGAVSLG
jgi:hypothetical protein